MGSLIKKILNKNGCEEIFKEIKVKNEYIYPRMDPGEII